MSHNQQDAMHWRIAPIIAIALAFGLSTARAQNPADNTSSPSRSNGTAEGRYDCPPDGSRIALFTRQAFDQGRESEVREFGKLEEQLTGILLSSHKDDDVIEKAIAAMIDFANKMSARGHDVRLRDLIIDLETRLNFLLSSSALKPIGKAQLELHIVVMKEVKRLMCR